MTGAEMGAAAGQGVRADEGGAGAGERPAGVGAGEAAGAARVHGDGRGGGLGRCPSGAAARLALLALALLAAALGITRHRCRPPGRGSVGRAAADNSSGGPGRGRGKGRSGAAQVVGRGPGGRKSEKTYDNRRSGAGRRNWGGESAFPGVPGVGLEVQLIPQSFDGHTAATIGVQLELKQGRHAAGGAIAQVAHGAEDLGIGGTMTADKAKPGGVGRGNEGSVEAFNVLLKGARAGASGPEELPTEVGHGGRLVLGEDPTARHGDEPEAAAVGWHGGVGLEEVLGDLVGGLLGATVALDVDAMGAGHLFPLLRELPLRKVRAAVQEVPVGPAGLVQLPEHEELARAEGAANPTSVAGDVAAVSADGASKGHARNGDGGQNDGPVRLTGDGLGEDFRLTPAGAGGAVHALARVADVSVLEGLSVAPRGPVAASASGCCSRWV